ncbi:MAG: YeiH family protein [Campylobacterales bacterium]
MAFSRHQRASTFSGIAMTVLFAFASMYIAQIPLIAALGFSPLVIAIILGIFYGNTLYHQVPKEWIPGIKFSMQKMLRLGIILYGFRITFQQIYTVGLPGLVADAIMLTTTFLLGYILGVRFFGLDRDTSILTASGASVCGAAAVLATEGVVKSESYKAAIAVATVVLFGTIAMFLYPFLYPLLDLSPMAFGIYTGATVHEVAQVVAAGVAISPEVMDTGVIVKMTRVMMLVPLLLVLGWFLSGGSGSAGERRAIVIPWFAIMFVVVAGFNSLHLLPQEVINFINTLDLFLLAMAMAAIGMETNISKFRGVGMKPIWVAGILFLWLVVAGYFVSKYSVAFLA